ncbi:protein kinase domain-containing protein [Luteimonas vadosa]|uniref:Serine/threonine-protein kinase n=1 Tax=Luteimonas vadosa TaxID=1165507 RepID=A0ABP9DQ91_9GAMM
MDAERWQRISPLLDALLELDGDARRRSLASLREDDPGLATEVEALLKLEEGQEEFLAEPVVAQLPHARPDAMIGPYRLERMLGEGGMGQVWLASRADGFYEKRVALKLLRPGLADPNLRLHFTRERQILARLEHAHIARLLDAGISADSQPYLALEHVEGEPITDWCRLHEPPLDQCVRLFLQVCDAVSHAHANLIVHRDLKPSNILVTALNEVRLLDFGIAKLLDTADQGGDNTRTGLRAFTLHYAAPEQIRGEPVTTMTDVYSLGVVLYELLAGSKPYQLARESDAQWEEAILNVDPVRPSLALLRHADDNRTDRPTVRKRARAISGDLDNIVLKAMSKRPEQRYPSVEALAQDLGRFLRGRPVHARPMRLSYRLRKYFARHRWAVSTAVLVTAVLMAALGIVGWQAQQAMRESARAQALQNFVIGLFENAGATPAGAPLDVRRLLEAGIERGELELAQQPVAHAELFGVVARIRAGLGDYEQALALLLREAAIVGTIEDPPPSLRLQLATDLGRTSRLLARYAECVETMRPWQALAQREERRLPVQVSEFYSQLGRCQRASGERAAAQALFQRALAIRRDVPGAAAAAVENLSDLASLLGDAGDTQGALDGQRRALAQLRDRVGLRHPLAIDLLRTSCSLQRELSEVRGAERDCRSALALSRALHGDQHRATIDARRQLAALLVDQGRLGEAGAEFRDTHGWLVSRLGEDHPDVALNYNSLGIVAWERGDVEEGVRDVQKAIEIWRRQDNEPRLASGRFNLALILHSVGRDAQARAPLVQALQQRAASYGATHPLVGDTWRLLGEVDAALGRDEAALAALRRGARLTRLGYGDTHSHTYRAQLSLARFQAERGDVTALQRLDSLAALGSPAPGDHELRKIAWLAGAYAAGVRCRGAQRDQASASLDAIEAEIRELRPEGGVVAREVAGVRRHCR